MSTNRESLIDEGMTLGAGVISSSDQKDLFPSITRGKVIFADSGLVESRTTSLLDLPKGVCTRGAKTGELFAVLLRLGVAIGEKRRSMDPVQQSFYVLHFKAAFQEREGHSVPGLVRADCLSCLWS